MPAKVKKIGTRYRVVEPSGKVVRAKKKSGAKGKATDGGGFTTKKQALKQVGAINTPKSKKRS